MHLLPFSPLERSFFELLQCIILLGRYGDTLNPWADMLTLAQAWCVSKPGARLAVGVPYVKTGDRIEYNAHRVYGPLMYPFLATNWEAEWVEDGKNDLSDIR